MNGDAMRELQETAKPLRRRDVRGHTRAQEAAHKRQQPEFSRRNPTLSGVATEAFAVALGHEMTWTGRGCWLDQELAVGTNRLETVMLKYDRFTRQEAHDQRGEGWTGKMNDIGTANQLPEANPARLADYAEWKRCIVEIICRSLRDQDNFKLFPAVGGSKLCEAGSERLNDGLDAANTWCEEMRVQKELHSRSF